MSEKLTVINGNDDEAYKRRPSKESQEKILAFADLNGRLPSEFSLNFEERRLGKALATIIAKRSDQYDAEFRAIILAKFPDKEVKERPVMRFPEQVICTKLDPNKPDHPTRKSDILEFVFQFKRRPSSKGTQEERLMYLSMRRFINKNDQLFDQKFADTLSRIVPSRAEKAARKKDLILKHLMNGKPLKDLTDELLMAYSNYTKIRGHAFDHEFTVKVYNLYKFKSRVAV